MTEREKEGGSGSEEGPDTVEWSFLRTVTVDARGLMAVTGRECWRYQAKILWPYLVGSELAPATAKRGDEKNVFNAASMLGMSRVRVSDAL